MGSNPCLRSGKKEMNLSEESDSDYRVAARHSLTKTIEGRMKGRIDRYMEEIGCHDEEDRRNGYFSRHLLTEPGDIELSIPRTRKFSAAGALRKYARPAGQISHLILACFVLGLSTRKVSEALFTILGGKVSGATLSRVARLLDRAVQSFHQRALSHCPWSILT